MNVLAKEIMGQAGNLSQGAEDQRLSVAESNASINQIDSSIRKVRMNVENLAELGESVSGATYQTLASIGDVGDNTNQLGQTAQEVVSAIEQMVSNIQGVSKSTATLADSAAQSRVSMEEIEGATRSIRDRAEEAARLSSAAHEGAAEAKQTLSESVAGVRKMNERIESTSLVMKRLGEQSRSIGDILDVISSVAADTHLLSLNASVIAAKAGEHGLGFSVVAREIKTLARRTSDNAKEIEGMITETQESVDNAIEAIEEGKLQVSKNMELSDRADRTLAEVLEKIEVSATNSRQIAQATEEQAASSTEIVNAIDAIRKMADLTAISAQNVSNTSMSVLHHSLLLRSEFSGISLPERPAQYVIGFLFDSITQERWKRERELFERRANDLGARCEFRIADGNPGLQTKQARELCELDVDVLIVVAVDGEKAAAIVGVAKNCGIPLIAYHRLIKSPGLDLLISFDGVETGRMQAETFVKSLAGPLVLLLHGSPTDMYAHDLRQGQIEVLGPGAESGQINIVDTLWVPDWSVEAAYDLTRNVIETKGPIDGVIASNDGTAGAAIRAAKELIHDRKVVVTGMDTELSACQRRVKGDQAMTVYMPIKLQASRAVEAALLLIKGEEIPGITDHIENQGAKTPSIFLKPIKVDAENMEEVVVKDGFHTREAIYGAEDAIHSSKKT